MNTQLQDTFKTLYREFNDSLVERLGELYTQDVVFEDPAHRIEGLSNVRDYFAGFIPSLNYCGFEVHRFVNADDHCVALWTMHFEHPKLAGGKRLSVTGCSHLVTQLDNGVEKIISHRDYFDMGAMLYEHVPLLGAGVRWLKERL